MCKPIAVIAGDIHYSLSTLEPADAVTRMAIKHANKLKVPFIANGDTHNDKALLRGEVVNRMLDTFSYGEISPIINIGNHCKINVNSDQHSLNFLAPYCKIIEEPEQISSLGVWVIPYFHDIVKLRDVLKTIPFGSILIMHQGVNTGKPGHYMKDSSALSPEDLAPFRTILSHYHERQDIRCAGNGLIGLATYIGNPYTLGFGEADHPEKGYQILYDDGALEFVPTNLRKHVILEVSCIGSDIGFKELSVAPNDLVWVKLKGTQDQISKWTKEKLSAALQIKTFKLDLISTDSALPMVQQSNKSNEEVLDSIIDTFASPAVKERLKALWRSLS